MKYNVAIGGIHIESSTFSSYLSGEKDFTILKGENLLSNYSWLNQFEKINFIPLTHARALPGGKVSLSFFNNWLTNFIIELEKVKDELDGILLDLHGAMFVEGIFDAEGYLIEKIRKIVGSKVLISVTSDLHGNISNLLFENVDLITCYKTAPHIDVLETKKRALVNLLYLLEEGKEKLIKVKIDLPILLPGEKTSTEVEPGKSLYQSLSYVTNNKTILDASIWMGFPWADELRSGATVIITGLEEKIVREEALKIANYFWDLKADFKFMGPVSSVTKALDTALSSNDKPFFISDTGDNPGAGGLGDLVIVLRKLMEMNEVRKIKKKVLFASFNDFETVKVLKESKSKRVKIHLGSKTDQSYGPPLLIEVEIIKQFKLIRAGEGFLVRVDNIYLIITENRFQYGKLEFFEESGIEKLVEFDVIVVKMGYLEPDLSRLQRGWVMALSEGAVNQDLLSLDYQKIKRPMYPFDEDFNVIFKPLIIKK